MVAVAQDAPHDAFEKKIRPVLAAHCYACHSASLTPPQAGLVLDSVRECLTDAEVVLIANADPVFKALGPGDFTDGVRHVTVVDFWRCVPALAGAAGIRYIGFGRGPDAATTATNCLSEMWSATAASHVAGAESL